MNKTQQALVKRLTTIQHFLDIYAEPLAPLNRGTARTELNALVLDAERLAVGQVTATERSRAQTALLRDLRVNLHKTHLQPIIAVANARIGRTRAAARLKLPARSASDCDLVAEAMSVAAVLRKRKSVLLAEYFEADCLDRLVVAAELVTAASAEAGRCRLEITSATQGIADVVRRGRELVRFLSALVTSKARWNKRLLAAWRKAAGVPQQKPAPRAAPVTTAIPDRQPLGGD
jgi:hypothetical protein